MAYSSQELFNYFVTTIHDYPADSEAMGAALYKLYGSDVVNSIIQAMRDPKSELTKRLTPAGDSMHKAGKVRMHKLEADDIRTMSFQIEAGVNKHLGLDNY
jgi:hypothetical protein